MKITKATIATLTLPEGKSDQILFDDSLPGFGIRLRPGKRTFIIQYRIGHGQRRETLGDAAVLDPDQARKEAKRRLGKVALGHDPQAEKREKAAKANNTFDALVPTFLASKKGRVRPATYEAIERHLLTRWKVLHGRPWHEVHRRDIAARLTKIEQEYGRGSARTSRAAMMEFGKWAMQMGVAENNPVIGTPEFPSGERDRVLTESELFAIWKAAEREGGEVGAIVRLLILTGARRTEIGDLAWSEITGNVLVIEGARTKNGKPLMLTLPPLAMEIIGSIPRREGRALVFGRGGRGFSAWSAAKRRIDKASNVENWSLHDLRRSFVTHAAEIGIQPHIIEQVVNHVSGHKGGIAGVYNKATYAAEVKTALLRWSEHVHMLVTGGEAKVLPLRA